MPVTAIRVSTDLSTDTVLKRMEYLARDLLREYGQHVIRLEQGAEEGETLVELSLNGYRLRGRLTFEPGKVVLEVNYPWTLLPYKDKVKNEITGVVKSLLR